MRPLAPYTLRPLRTVTARKLRREPRIAAAPEALLPPDPEGRRSRPVEIRRIRRPASLLHSR
jgi:hypothetical protein